MTRASASKVQIVTIVLTSLLSSGAAAQAALDPVHRLTQHQIELAAAAYVGQTLVAEHADKDPEFLKGLMLDQRSTYYSKPFDENEVRPLREARYAGRLAQALGVQLTDGQHAVTCTSAGTSCSYNFSPRHGLIRMSVPRVHDDTADVAVDLVALLRGGASVYRTGWDLRLVKRAGTWEVVPHLHSRTSY